MMNIFDADFTYTPRSQRCKEVKSRYEFHACNRPDLILLLLKRDESIDFYGIFDLQVLIGNISVQGYDCVPCAYDENNFITLSAPISLGPPITLAACVQLCESSHSIRQRISPICDELEEVMRTYSPNDAIILLRLWPSNAAVFTRELFDSTFFVPKRLTDAILLSDYCCAMARRVHVHYPFAELEEIIALIMERPVSSIVMIAGPKKVGKSRVCRILANMLISRTEKSVFVLDGDVGQAETTPPGCVSLFQVTSPLLGVPHLQQRAPELSYFFGSISPDQNPNHYLSLLIRIVEYYRLVAPVNSVLIFNSCGFVEGIGETILTKFIELVKPLLLVNIYKEGLPGFREEIATEYLVKTCRIKSHVWRLPKGELTSRLTSASLRSLLVTGYLSAISPYPELRWFGRTIPYRVPFDSITIYVHPHHIAIPETHIFQLLNLSFVALCKINDMQTYNRRRILQNDSFPWILNRSTTSPVMRVYGFGVIRAVDLDARLFYIITPVDKQALREVNVIGKSSQINISPPFIQREDIELQTLNEYDDLVKSVEESTKHALEDPFVENCSLFENSQNEDQSIDADAKMAERESSFECDSNTVCCVKSDSISDCSMDSNSDRTAEAESSFESWIDFE